MTDINRPPLWQVLFNAGNPPCPVEEMLAAEIRALRDWLVPEEPLYDGDRRWELERDERQRLRALLTEQAEIAERGDG